MGREANPTKTVGGWRIHLDEELGGSLDREELEALVTWAVDPGRAVETIHWGRNYLYRTALPLPDGTLDVVVKQFRTDGAWERLRRRVKGSKAWRSWRTARALREHGLSTPRPLLCIESEGLSGPTFYVCERLAGAAEARYWMRALNADRHREDYPWLDHQGVLLDLGRLVRRLHERRIWHRDMTSGNVLFDPGEGAPRPELHLVDLNRARLGVRVGAWRSARELGRMPILRQEHQELYLRGYWQPRPVPGWHRLLYRWSHRAFLARNRSKQRLRGGLRSLGETLRPRRRAHAHIPAPERGAGVRDRVVWDPLSDQPHQHASKWQKNWVRLRDLPSHLEGLWLASRALARARDRLDEERRTRLPVGQPVAGIGVGISVDPRGLSVELLLERLDELAVRHVLLRLYPWRDDCAAEEELARTLCERGVELTFALPQNRELVREPERWQRAVGELARRFAPWGRHFQVGQAVNRSKWGVWRADEYVELFRRASEEIRAARPDAELLGPAVIDFEPHATAAYLELDRSGLCFDVLSSLLYVDRRGAPENAQLGLDTAGKAALLRALAEGSRNCPSGRSWITEVNWPLWEGPHSPAGRDVAVDEERQASYLVRYYLLTLGSGLVERVFWWQLAAKGYGLIDPSATAGGRRRPSFFALRTLVAELAGARWAGELEGLPSGVRGVRFTLDGGGERWVVWSPADATTRVELPAPVGSSRSRDGEPGAVAEGALVVEVDGAPLWLDPRK